MNLTLKVKSFVITASTEKEAYLKGCKQLAKYMASKKYKNLTFKIERTSGNENTFIFTMFTNLDLGEEQRNYCKTCRDYHCSFFINEDYNCSRCNLKNFLEKKKKKSRISKSFYNHEMKDKGE